MKKFLWMLPALLMAACNDDNEGKKPEPEANFEVISFESDEHMLDAMTGEDVALVDLKMSLWNIGDYVFSKVYCAKDYAVDAAYDGPLFANADQSVWFGSYYAWGFDSWGGFAVSTIADSRPAAASLTQQFSVCAQGGANNTKTFAVCYDMNSGMEGTESEIYMAEYGYPTIELTDVRTFDHLYIANSAWTYAYFTGDDADRFSVIISGWKGQEKTGEVQVALVAGKSKCSDWQKVDLRGLGAVDKIVFKASVDDVMAPTYFCIDEIALVPELSE